MNQVNIFGNLGADPELKMTQGGMAILKLRVATSERIKKNDEWVDHTEWHSVTVFGKRGEGLAKILNKGSKVLVTGKLRTSSYEKDGEKRYRTEIIGDDVFLGGGKRRDNDGDSGGVPDPDPNNGSEISEDDLPF